MPEPGTPTTRSLDAAAVASSLRRLAARDGAPWLHAEVARRMAQRLELIRLQPAQVLDWWSFLGAGAQHLDKAYPKARRIVVEPTEALAARSRAANRSAWWRLGAAARTPVLLEDQVPAHSQLVWANMMLHAVKDPPSLMARWHDVLSADGFVMFSCFGPDTVRELRALYQRRGWPAPTLAFVDMHDLGDMLLRAGFADPVMDQETLTLTWGGPEALLGELRALGGNASPERFGGLRTPRWKRELERELESLAGSDGRLRLSFEIAYGHAFKAAPRLRADAPTTVSLDDMRALVRAGRRPGPGIAGP
jgi:malonyl-CoA O-methyltransferase